MKIVGIDAGSSNIKIVATNESKEIIGKILLSQMSIEEALEKFIKQFNIKKEEISKIIITGIGQSKITDNVFGIQTTKVDEFEAIGIGATYLTNMEEALIVSIGTGTAFIRAKNGKYTHIGGSRSWRRNTNKLMQAVCRN